MHEENGEKKILPSSSLICVVLSLYLDNEKADKLTKMDHRAKNLGIEVRSSLGGSEKDLHPFGLFHSAFHNAAILTKFYFNSSNCYAVLS